MTSQRNFLDKLRARGESTREIQTLARRRYANFPTNRRIKTEERRILNFRIKEKDENIRKAKIEWGRLSKKCESGFPRAGKERYKKLKRVPKSPPKTK